MTKSQSLIGFRFRHFSHLFNEYLKNLIELYSNDKLKIILDFGQNSPNGPFEGIDAVVKGVEVKFEKTFSEFFIYLIN